MASQVTIAVSCIFIVMVAHGVSSNPCCSHKRRLSQLPLVHPALPPPPPPVLPMTYVIVDHQPASNQQCDSDAQLLSLARQLRDISSLQQSPQCVPCSPQPQPCIPQPQPCAPCVPCSY